MRASFSYTKRGLKKIYYIEKDAITYKIFSIYIFLLLFDAFSCCERGAISFRHAFYFAIMILYAWYYWCHMFAAMSIFMIFFFYAFAAAFLIYTLDIIIIMRFLSFLFFDVFDIYLREDAAFYYYYDGDIIYFLRYAARKPAAFFDARAFALFATPPRRDTP